MRPLVLAITAFVLLAGMTAAVLVLTAPAAEPVPEVWVAYAGDPGNPYIDAARAGLLEASRNNTFTYEEFTPATADRLEAALANASTDPPKLVVVQDSGTWAGAADRWAAAHPRIRFVVIDGEAALRPNVRTVAIAADGVSYLAGALAATAGHGQPVAVLLGMPHPVLNGFRDGFRAGVGSVAPGAAVEVRYVGNSTQGYADPARAAAIAEGLYQNGTSVIYAVCGGSSLGVIDAAGNATGRFVIGVDRDQRALGPDVVLGSAVKHVEGVVQTAIEDGLGEAFAPGTVRVGLADGATDLVPNPRFAAYGSAAAARREVAEAMDR
ncbi:MAG: BMP family ABC transporter substrate-binding protein [Methanospirillum sp.]